MHFLLFDMCVNYSSQWLTIKFCTNCNIDCMVVSRRNCPRYELRIEDTKIGQIQKFKCLGIGSIENATMKSKRCIGIGKRASKY